MGFGKINVDDEWLLLGVIREVGLLVCWFMRELPVDLNFWSSLRFWSVFIINKGQSSPFSVPKCFVEEVYFNFHN